MSQINISAEEVGAASGQVASGSQMLKSLIENFELKDTNSSGKNISFNSDEIDYFAMNEY